MNRTAAKAAVVGIGATSFGVFPGQTSYSLGASALQAALSDAAMKKEEIDALIVVRIPDYQRFAQMYGFSPSMGISLQPQGRMSGVAMHLANALISSGTARNVALVYGNDGKSSGARYGGVTDRYSGEGATTWLPYGMTSPGATHAMMFAMHAHRYGTTSTALAHVAVAFREHATLNPAAVMRKPLSIEEHQASKFIAEPLHLFDYCQINDGGVAMILTQSERVGDHPHKPAYIRATGCETELANSLFPMQEFWYPSMRKLSKRIYADAGLDPADMQALMVYDNFTPTVLFSLEGFGYCKQGESGPWVSEGHIARGGRYPTNTSGGHLSESYMQGWALLAESVRQVRGEALERQVVDAHNVHYMCAASISSSVIFSDTP